MYICLECMVVFEQAMVYQRFLAILDRDIGTKYFWSKFCLLFLKTLVTFLYKLRGDFLDDYVKRFRENIYGCSKLLIKFVLYLIINPRVLFK